MKIQKAPIVICNPIDTTGYPQFINDFIARRQDKDLSIFYGNLRSLKIEPCTPNELLNKNHAAEYDIGTNTLKYVEEVSRDHIMHEVLHVSNRIDMGDYYLEGFMQVDKDDNTIGVGLNEGFTELYHQKYFSDYIEHKDLIKKQVYPLTRKIVDYLNVLLNDDYVESLYERSDLYTLYEDLSTLSSPQKTMKFFKDIDLLFYYADNHLFASLFKTDIIFRSYSRVKLFLAECFFTKLSILKKQGLLTEEEYNMSIDTIYELLDKPLVFLKVIKTKPLSPYFDEILKKVNKKKIEH